VANTKISALTSATTPLAGTETLPIVQSGVTVKVAVSDLTAGRAVATGALTVTGAISVTTTGKVGTTFGVGNATPSASGAGITFPATQSASSDANTLDDYEEGTWTAAFVSTGGTITISTGNRTGKYVKIGSQVTVTGVFVVNSVSAPTGELTMSGLPFANGSADSNCSVSAIFAQGLAATAITAIQAKLNPSSTSIYIARFNVGSAADLASSMQASAQIFISLTYFI
jgi:hypothetical protein